MAGGTSIDRAVQVQKTHARLEPARLQELERGVYLVLRAWVFRVDAELCPFRPAKLQQAEILVILPAPDIRTPAAFVLDDLEQIVSVIAARSRLLTQVCDVVRG